MLTVNTPNRERSVTNRFQDRVVVVTGAASGLGQVSACRFAAEGAQLILVDVNEKGLEETAGKIKAIGAKSSIHAFDVTDENAINRFGELICAQHAKIQVLYNNAGAAYGEVTQMVDQANMERWLHFLALNSIAPLLLAKALRPSLANAKGVVLNQSSMASYAPATVYGVTKATLNSLTYGMAHVFARDGIRVVAIAPGLMETPASKQQLTEQTQAHVRSLQLSDIHGTADDIADLALFLASDQARFINCEIVNCDAGSRLRGWRG